jgi:Tfp pilus assembly protein PilN
MIRINLLPKEERARSAPKLRLPKMGAMVPLIGVAAVLGIVTVIAVLEHAKVAALNKDVVELRDEVRAIQPQVDRVRKLTTQREELERRLDIIRQLDQGRFLCVRMMDDVSRNTPNYMWLTDIRQNAPRSISVTGITFSNLIVADFMTRLEQSSMFASIGLTQTNRGQIEERDVMEFAITADLTPEELPTDFKAEALIQDLIQEAN